MVEEALLDVFRLSRGRITRRITRVDNRGEDVWGRECRNGSSFSDRYQLHLTSIHSKSDGANDQFYGKNLEKRKQGKFVAANPAVFRLVSRWRPRLRRSDANMAYAEERTVGGRVR